jgi:hypothetical protein
MEVIMIRRLTPIALVLSSALSLHAGPIDQFIGMLEPDRKFASSEALFEHYGFLFDVLQNEIEEEICSRANISREQWYEMYEETAARFKDDHLRNPNEIFEEFHCEVASDKLKALTQNVLQDLNFQNDVDLFALPSSDSAHGHAVNGVAILMKERSCCHDDGIGKCYIAHELFHVKFKDAARRAVLERLLPYERALHLRFRQINETRADILAAAVSYDYAVAFERIAREIDGLADVYPTGEQYRTIIATILKQFEAIRCHERGVNKQAKTPGRTFSKKRPAVDRRNLALKYLVRRIVQNAIFTVSTLPSRIKNYCSSGINQMLRYIRVLSNVLTQTGYQKHR